MKSKTQVPTKVKEHLVYLKGKNFVVKYIRCNNAGEQGAALDTICNKFDITLEYTGPNHTSTKWCG